MSQFFSYEKKLTRVYLGDFSQRPKKDFMRTARQGELYNTNGPSEVSLDEKRSDSSEWRPSSRTGSDLRLLSASNSTLFHARSSDDDATDSLSQSFVLTDNETSLSFPSLNGKLPNSDAEFAAIMGILGDADLDSLKEVFF